MSSAPFKTGLPIVDKPWNWYCNHFILRSKSVADFQKKIDYLRSRISDSTVLRVIEYGFRPDHPIPTAMHFSEIIIDSMTENTKPRVPWKGRII